MLLGWQASICESEVCLLELITLKVSSVQTSLTQCYKSCLPTRVTCFPPMENVNS